MRKIQYNIMRFRDTVFLDEAEVLKWSFKSVSATYHVLHDPENLPDKYVTALDELSDSREPLSKPNFWKHIFFIK